MRPVAFHLDPMCPWSWIASRWLREVRDRAGLEVTWRLLSLRVLDDAAVEPPPDRIRAIHARGHDLLCLLAAAREVGGNDAVGRLYEVLGRAIWERRPAADEADLHPAQRPLRPVDLPSALAAAALPTDLSDRVGASHDEVVRGETAAAVAAAGPDLGSPVVVFEGGGAFFGPVVERAPTGTEAVEAWRGLEALAALPGFLELKHGHRSPPRLPVLAGEAPRADVAGGGDPPGS